MMATIAVKDGAIATSGDYERYFIKDGVRYHHILDPLTGFPARASRSVTILADELIWADALATAVFVLGRKRGVALIEERHGTEALIIDGEGRATLSSGMKGRVKFQ
jgi:thiamine biosynthesis lipoprotein